MLKNWKHIAAVAWLVAVVALILFGYPLAGVIVFAAGVAALAVLRWTDSLKPDELIGAMAVALAVAVAGHVTHTAVGDTAGVGEDIAEQVDDNTDAIAVLDQAAEAAAGYRSALADGEEPLTDACDELLASLDQLRFVGGEPVTAGGEERLHIVATLARAVGECAAIGDDQ